MDGQKNNLYDYEKPTYVNDKGHSELYLGKNKLSLPFCGY